MHWSLDRSLPRRHQIHKIGERRALVQAINDLYDLKELNPVIAKLDHSVAGPVPAAEDIDVNGLFTGNHHYPIPDQIARLREVAGAVAAQA